MKRLLIAGFGDLGQRLASRLERQGEWQLHAVRRSAAQSDSITFYRADLTRAETLGALPKHVDAIVYQATPAERTAAAYQAIYLEGLQNLLVQTTSDQLIVVSSTAVFGQDQGQWVDERSATEPERFNGRILLEAEQEALAAGGQVVRFSGIYGPGRKRLLQQVRSGQAACGRDQIQWTNRIHADDAAAVLDHVLSQPDLGPVICASDDRPSPRCEVLDWLAKKTGSRPPTNDDVSSNNYAAGKRVSNHRLRVSGFEFTYPDFRAGYRKLIANGKI